MTTDLSLLAKLPGLLAQAQATRQPIRGDIFERPLDAETSARIAAQSTDLGFGARAVLHPAAIPGVAEGDSWFDYLPNYLEDPVRGDLLGHLNYNGKVNVFKVAKAGDTLENMVYGTGLDGHFEPDGQSQIKQTLEAISRHRAKFFLFSAGGNDVAGLELEAYLNHQGRDGHPSGLPVFRDEHVDYVFDTVFPRAFGDIISQVKAASPGIHIFLHGYANAIPDGRAVVNTPVGWHFVGPWLLPALSHKRVPADQKRGVITQLITRLNNMLAALARANENVHYIDCRPVVDDADWVNELHLSSSGFGKVAALFEQTILAKLAP